MIFSTLLFGTYRTSFYKAFSISILLYWPLLGKSQIGPDGNMASVAKATNLPPYISSSAIPPLSFVVGQGFSITLPRFTDPENGLMEYTVEGQPPGVYFWMRDSRDNSELRWLLGVPTTPGTFTMTYSATDTGMLTGSVDVLITVKPNSPLLPNIQEVSDKVTCDVIGGWIWNRTLPNTPINLEFFADDISIGTTVADMYRQDLKSAGIGNGAHGYNFIMPTEIKDGKAHLIKAKILGTEHTLNWGPELLSCPVGVKQLFQDYRDKITCDFFSGWIWDKTQPDAPVSIEFLADNVVLGSTVANTFRQDLVDRGIGNGVHGYTFITPTSLKDGKSHRLTARVPGRNYTLPWARVLSCPVGVSQFFQEYTDRLNCNDFRGWIWDKTQPNDAVTVEFLANNVVIGSTIANNFRQDLVDRGLGNGEHGYKFVTPASLKDGKTYQITARVPGRNYTLPWPSRAITCPSGGRQEAIAEVDKPAWKVTWVGKGNPDQLNVEIQGAAGKTLLFQLYDLNGKLLGDWAFTNQIDRQQHSLPARFDAPKLLLLRVSDDNRQQTLKILTD